MNLLSIGLSHATAPVEVRERVAFEPGEARAFLAGLDTAAERALLSTCNRTELIVLAEGGPDLADDLAARLDRAKGADAFRDPKFRVVREGEEAARHVFRVACGLDSMVLGEDQILGQVDEAHAIARSADTVDAVLGRLFESAVRLGGKVRSETNIGRGAVSVGTAAVGLATKIFGSLEDRKALVVGAGTMGTLAARHLRSSGVASLAVANRTLERAERLAEETEARTVPLCGIPAELDAVDMVVSATGGGTMLLTKQTVRGALANRRYRPLLLLDISVPRSVDPSINDLENVFLQDIDALRSIIDANLHRRRKAAKKVERACEDATRRFLAWRKSLAVEPTLRELRDKLDRVARRELDRTMKKVPDELRPELERLTKSLVSKILHDPTARLREEAGRENGLVRRLATLREVFGLEEADASSNRDEG